MNARTKACLLAGVALLALGGRAWAGEEAKISPEVEAYLADNDTQAVRYALEPQVSDAEKNRVGLIQSGVKSADQDGSWSKLSGRQAIMVSPRAVATQALRKNLELAIARGDKERAQEIIKEAESVFQPVVDLTFVYTESMTYRRQRIGIIGEKKIGNPPTDPVVDINSTYDALTGVTSVPESPRITKIVYASRAGGVVEKQILASDTPVKQGPNKKPGYNVSIDQQLPWGPSLNIASTARYQRIYPGSAQGQYIKGGYYTADITITLSAPLPFSKDFGPYSTKETAIKLSRVDQDRQDSLLKLSLNQILLQADMGYWNLVKATEALQATVKHREYTSQLFQRTQRLYDNQLVSEYQLLQMKAEDAKAEIRLENARQAYLLATQTLAQVIDDTPVSLTSKAYVPFAYSAELESFMNTNFAEAIKTAKTNRQELQLEKIGRETDKISFEAAKTQARPDVKFNGSVALKQNRGGDGTAQNPSYGYNDLFSAYANLNPISDIKDCLNCADQMDQTYKATYVYPWANRVANATVEIAKLQLQDREYSNKDAKLAATKDISDALMGLGNARARAEAAKKERERITKAYEGLERRQTLQGGSGAATDEIISTLRKVLDAELRYINALVDNKVAESRYLAAQGVLANEYGDRTAVSSFDKERISMLGSSGALSFFKPKRVAASGE